MLSQFPLATGSGSVCFLMMPLNGAFWVMCHCVLPQALHCCSSGVPPVHYCPLSPLPASLLLPTFLLCIWSSSVFQSSCLSYLHHHTLSQVPAGEFSHPESCFTAHFYCSSYTLSSLALCFLPPLHSTTALPRPSHRPSLSTALDKEAVSFYLLPTRKTLFFVRSRI